MDPVARLLIPRVLGGPLPCTHRFGQPRPASVERALAPDEVAKVERAILGKAGGGKWAVSVAGAVFLQQVERDGRAEQA